MIFNERCPPKREYVAEIHHGKAPLSEAHAIELIDLFTAVDPAAAVDADDQRQLSFLILRSVNVENIPFMLAVADIIETLNAIGGGKPLVALRVINRVASAKLF